MSLPVDQHPSSYRDPSGFLFYKDGILYRQVNKVFKKDFDHFIQSGLYQHLVEKKMLIPHQTITENLTGSDDCYTMLQPEIIPFISYPYEWCFDMLKDAALLTLEIAKEALNFGMMLKDASAYNVQFHEGKMIFIDTLSFEQYDEQKPWIAYRQFCEHFFAPLALMHYLKEPLQNLFTAYPNGIPLSLTRKLLPFKSKLHLHTYLHLHLQSSITKKDAAKSEENNQFSKKKMSNLLRSLTEGIQSFSFSQSKTAWSNYYDEASQRGNYIDAKKKIITRWLHEINTATAFDAGANEGEFSELISNKKSSVISADFDHASINKLYNSLKRKNIQSILPLVIDLSNPSPSIGANSKERISFLDRTRVDLTIALALIHHLAIGKNIPFYKVAEVFSIIGNYLIIEFVPKQDEKVHIMLQQKKDVYTDYTEENFLKDFKLYFSILDRQDIGNSNRTVYLMKRHE